MFLKSVFVYSQILGCFLQEIRIYVQEAREESHATRERIDELSFLCGARVGERQVTVDGVTYPLAAPFFVAATQNPLESQGTFPLPEAQIDRFLMRISLGYPERDSERAMLDNHGVASPLSALAPVCTREEITAAAAAVRGVTVSDKVKGYILDLVAESRTSARVRLGVSPRGALALMHAAQAYAAIEGRDFVLPDDVRSVAVPVMAHRIISRSQNAIRLNDTGESIVELILDTVPAPID